MSDVLPYIGSKSREYVLHISATSLAGSGYPVIPLRWPRNGGCSCPRGRTCGKAAKHPLTAHGLKDATTDQTAIDTWWSKWPRANIGLCTGNGLVVVDIDGPEGEAQAAELDLPMTVESRTGNGRHLYYSGESKNRIRLRPGIDIRGEGGYVIAPPSIHASGVIYEWVNSPEEHDIAPLPAWVTDRPEARITDGQTASGPIERRLLTEGERNNELFRFACLLRSVGVQADEIAAAVDARNMACCEPQLDLEEIVSIAYSAAEHPGVHLSDAQLLDLRIHPYTLPIYLAIRARADHKGVCIAGYETLANDAGLAISRVKSTAVRELEALGLVAVKRPPPLKLNQPRLANEYTLLNPEEQSTAPADTRGTTTQGEEDDRR